MKIKRVKPAQTKEQQADADGWVYVTTSKIIRGWDRVWIEGARAQAREVEKGRAERPKTRCPTGCDLQAWSAQCTDNGRGRV